MQDNLETEIKFRLRNKKHAEELAGRLERTITSEMVLEKNRLFDTAEGTLKKKRWVLRLRSVLEINEKESLLGGGRFYLTLKTPTEKDVTRNEYETILGKSYRDFHTFVRILEHLGFQEVFLYEKLRKDFKVSGVLVSIAEVPLLGHWIEFEGEEQDIFSFASSLGFKRTEALTKSFRTLWEEAASRGDVPSFTHVTFSRKRRK